MRRAVERYLEDPLAEEIIRGHFQETEPIIVTVEGDKLAFSQKAAAAAAAAK
jgi:ATP-dependent Clp protease ATP-binding subunit ClpC